MDNYNWILLSIGCAVTVIVFCFIIYLCTRAAPKTIIITTNSLPYPTQSQTYQENLEAPPQSVYVDTSSTEYDYYYENQRAEKEAKRAREKEEHENYMIACREAREESYRQMRIDAEIAMGGVVDG
jgi:hypothetical protein